MLSSVLLIGVLLAACSSQDQPVGPDDDHSHIDAKHVQTYNPYEGLTEEQYWENFGTTADVAALLKVMAERIADLMTNVALRTELAGCLNEGNRSVPWQIGAGGGMVAGWY